MANTRNQELGLLGLLYVDMELFTFHTCLPCLELGDTLLLGVCDEQQVVSEEKLPRYTNAELMWKRLQHQDDEQWAKGRVLMHINSHAKLTIVLNIDLHMTLGIGVHDLNDTHSPCENRQVHRVCGSEHKLTSIIVYTVLTNNVLVCAVHLFGNMENTITIWEYCGEYHFLCFRLCQSDGMLCHMLGINVGSFCPLGLRHTSLHQGTIGFEPCTLLSYSFIPTPGFRFLPVILGETTDIGDSIQQRAFQL